MVEEVDSVDEEERNNNEQVQLSNINQGSVGMEVTDLTLDEEGIPTKRKREPERYDPETGRYYSQQAEYFHNLMMQTLDQKVNLQYEEGEAKVFTELLNNLKAHCKVQQYMLKRDLKEFHVEGMMKGKEKLVSMHARTSSKEISVKELT